MLWVGWVSNLWRSAQHRPEPTLQPSEPHACSSDLMNIRFKQTIFHLNLYIVQWFNDNKTSPFIILETDKKVLIPIHIKTEIVMTFNNWFIMYLWYINCYVIYLWAIPLLGIKLGASPGRVIKKVFKPDDVCFIDRNKINICVIMERDGKVPCWQP